MDEVPRTPLSKVDHPTSARLAMELTDRARFGPGVPAGHADQTTRSSPAAFYVSYMGPTHCARGTGAQPDP